MEKEKAHPLTKGDVQPSALAEKLLNLWAHGSLSASAVQDLAHGAILDGAEHEEQWGTHKGSCHRDIMAYFCPELTLCDSWDIQVPCLDPKTSKETHADASLLVPHLMFWQLGENHPEQFQAMFGTQELESFWANVEKCGDPRLHGHWICLDKRPDLHTFAQEDHLDKRSVHDPIFCHGDAHDLELEWAVEFFTNTPFPHALGLLPQSSNKLQDMGFLAGLAQMEFPCTPIRLPSRGWP
eukprot:s292_g41.t1